MYAFDLLFINGESLVQMPLQDRRQKLWDSFQKVDGQFQFATSKDPQSVEEIEEFLDESLKGTLFRLKTIFILNYFLKNSFLKAIVKDLWSKV